MRRAESCRISQAARAEQETSRAVETSSAAGSMERRAAVLLRAPPPKFPSSQHTSVRPPSTRGKCRAPDPLSHRHRPRLLRGDLRGDLCGDLRGDLRNRRNSCGSGLRNRGGGVIGERRNVLVGVDGRLEVALRRSRRRRNARRVLVIDGRSARAEVVGAAADRDAEEHAEHDEQVGQLRARVGGGMSCLGTRSRDACRCGARAAARTFLLGVNASTFLAGAFTAGLGATVGSTGFFAAFALAFFLLLNIWSWSAGRAYEMRLLPEVRIGCRPIFFS